MMGKLRRSKCFFAENSRFIVTFEKARLMGGGAELAPRASWLSWP